MSTLSGVVRVKDGGVPNGAVVELHNSGGDVVDQVVVDDDGRYAYHLSAGSWSLAAWDAAGHRARAELDLGAGEDKDLNLELA